MSVILPYLYIVFFTLSLVIIFNERFEICLPITIILCTLVSFFGGFINNVKIGFYFCIIICFASLPLLIINRKEYKNIISNYFTIGFFVFTLLYLLINIFHRNTTLFYWDEFMHWGPMASETNRLNSFYSVNESTLMVHKDYPPFASLLENLWFNFVGYYSESLIFRSLSVFSITLIIPLLKKFKLNIDGIKNSLFVILAFLFVNSINYIEFNTFFDTIYVDYLLGLMGVYCIYLSLQLVTDRTRFNLFNLTISLVSILLLKQMGIAFFLLSVFVVVLGFIFDYKELEIKQVVKYLIVVIVIPAIFMIVWKMYISGFDSINSQFSVSQFSFSNLLKILFLNVGKEWQIITLHNFLEAIPYKNLILCGNICLSFFSCVLGISLIMIFLSYIGKNKDNKIIALTFILGAFGYTFAMLLLYLFSFDSYEGPHLASFERYFNTYIYFGLLLVLLMITNVYKFKKISYNSLFVSYICLLLALTNSNYSIFVPRAQENSYITKESNKISFEKIENHTKPGSNILIISQFQDDLVWILRYKYVDRRFDVISLGEKKYDSDVYSKNIDISEWKEMLNSYNYIYTYFTDQEFYEKYWKSLTNVYLWDKYVYKYENNDFCLVEIGFECSK